MIVKNGIVTIYPNGNTMVEQFTFQLENPSHNECEKEALLWAKECLDKRLKELETQC